MRYSAYIKYSNIKNLFIFIVLLSACFIILSSDNAYAQRPLVRFFDVIDYDADWNRLVRPSFAMSDPDTGEIYIIDGHGRVIIYSSELYPLFTMGKSHHVELPEGLALDNDGNLYVLQSFSERFPRYRISIFNSCLKWVRDISFDVSIGEKPFIPYRMAIDKKGYLYIAGIRYPGVIVLDKDYKPVDLLAPVEDDKAVTFINVAIDDDGLIYLVSEDKGHIYVYDENREFLFQFGEKGGSAGKLSRPRAVGFDSQRGWVYVVDYMRHTINAYDKNGGIIFEFGGMGWGEGWFRFPIDISVSKSGDVIVTDLFNQRVQVFKPY